MFVLDGLDGLLEPGVLAYVPAPAMGAAVGCEWLFSALHGSCPIDAQHPQHKGQGDGYEPQGEGEKGVHGLGSSVTGYPGHPPFSP